MTELTGYFEVLNGCAGDMLAGSIIDAGLSLEDLKKELEKIPLSSYEVTVGKVKKKTAYGHSLEATQFRVLPSASWDDSTSYRKITGLIDASSLSPGIKERIKKVFSVLAEAEGAVHGEPIENVHFHQVGQIDAIIEIASVVIGLDILGVQSLYSSSVGVSKPAPATVMLLKGIPSVLKSIDAEIITPTGAAILKGLCRFGMDLSGVSIQRAGYGAGEKEFAHPNTANFFLCSSVREGETVAVISTNIDDMSPIFFETLMERLFLSGALDVSLFTGAGKKNRPVFKLEVICPRSALDGLSEIIFRETTTLGIRFREESRKILERTEEKITTRWGEVKLKKGYYKGEAVNVSPEYDDCKNISKEHGIPLKVVFSEILRLIK